MLGVRREGHSSNFTYENMSKTCTHVQLGGELALVDLEAHTPRSWH